MKGSALAGQSSQGITKSERPNFYSPSTLSAKSC